MWIILSNLKYVLCWTYKTIFWGILKIQSFDEPTNVCIFKIPQNAAYLLAAHSWCKFMIVGCTFMMQISHSPPWELELRPLGVATGNALSVTRVWRYICKNTTCWPATAHDVTTGVPQYKCRRENTSSAFSSSLTGLFEACNLVRVQFSLYQMASTSKAFKIVCGSASSLFETRWHTQSLRL